MDFVTIIAFATYFDAAPVKSRLESEGINCFLRDEHSATINPVLNNSIGGIKLDILAKDYEAARAILLDMGYPLNEEETDMPWVVQKTISTINKISSTINNIPHAATIGSLLRKFLIFVLIVLALLLILYNFFPILIYGIMKPNYG